MKKMITFLLLIVTLLSCSKEQEKVLRSLSINSVKITCPPKNNGQEWDTFSAYPDPYFVYVNTSQDTYESPVLEESQISVWQTYLVLFADQMALMTFHDEDGDTDDLIENIYIDPKELKSLGYPPEFVFFANNGSTIVLSLDYIFQ